MDTQCSKNIDPKRQPLHQDRNPCDRSTVVKVNRCRQRTLAPLTLKKGLVIANVSCVETLPLITMIKESLADHVSDFKVSYLLGSFMDKYCDEKTVSPKVRAKAALDKLRSAEVRNGAINDNGYGLTTSVPLSCVLHRASKLISDALGTFSKEEFYANTRFTNGATTSRPKSRGHAYLKYSVHNVGLDVTRSALPHAIEAIKTIPLWVDFIESSLGYGFFKNHGWVNVISWNKVGTVPKKTDCDRATASEPDLNQFLQLSIGSMIRRRLRRVGIDLNDQRHNQRLALRGSIDNSLATIDLSSASDLNSQRLVWDLLPPDWYSIMDDCRSKYGIFPDGCVTRWEMFSSMGNGFTFELESLLFWALSKATCEIMDPSATTHTVSVYGDDIIVPSAHALAVIEVLEAVGHKPNVEKTFIDGPFRESCGAHYHNGIDVTPFYIREPLVKLTSLIRLGNQILKWSCQSGLPDVYLINVWRLIRDKTPRGVRGGRDLERSDALVTSEQPKFKLGFTRKLVLKCGDPERFVWYQGRKENEDPYMLPDFKDLIGGDTIQSDGTICEIVTEDVKVNRVHPSVAWLSIPFSFDQYEGDIY